jgi:hypothetical protein
MDSIVSLKIGERIVPARFSTIAELAERHRQEEAGEVILIPMSDEEIRELNQSGEPVAPFGGTFASTS